jgi:hypothetical protein
VVLEKRKEIDDKKLTEALLTFNIAGDLQTVMMMDDCGCCS